MATVVERGTIHSCGSSSAISCHHPSKISQQTAMAKPLSAESIKSNDAFLYYSNDDIRMKTLKLEEVPETVGAIEIRVPRKTRISFELHPSVLLEDLMEEEDGDNEDIIFDSIDNNSIDHLLELLIQL
mmetsp:Transcript_17077/g.36085  ORF Transcript_17077/g.36085 Transcript_17077/m.36085 type:complete len:128 (-) Transcript_17077:83-466(-)